MSLMKNTFIQSSFDQVANFQAHCIPEVIANNRARRLDKNIAENPESAWKKRII
ncbi:unnamed protein product [Moneuplotes crassus]|uniref:Uncharacterized protein n=1 Tax=Euplotes crassus TaxID=5936 RepID=A0AAD1X8D5_EUPCR|nr:unnamed protein product [Moneuplotes crassus]